MAMEVDRLTVKVDTDFRGLTSGLQSATRNIQGFKREVEGTQAQLGKGGDFPVRTDTKQVDLAKSKVGGLRQDLNTGGTFEVRADTSGLDGVSSRVAAIRADVANNATLTVNADVDTTAATASLAAFEAQKAAASTDIHSNVDIDTAGATASLSALAAEKTAASTDIHSNVDVDTAGATAQLGAFQGLVSWFDGKEINMPVDIDTISAVVGLFSVQAAVVSLGAQLLGLSVSSAIASGSLTGLGAVAATAAVGIASLGAAVVAVVTAVEIVHTLGSAVLGATAAFAGLGAGAVVGLGLVAGAVYALTQATGPLGEAFAGLSDHASNLYYDFQAAFEPAAALIPPIGEKALDVAQNYIPLLGQAAEATIGAMAPVFDSFLTWLDEGGAGFGFMSTIIEGATPIMGALSDTVVSLLQGFVAIAATATPAAIELADSIAAIAQRFAEWATSAEGQEQILGWIETAKIIFPAIRDAIVEIVDAFSSMEGFDAQTLADGIRSVGEGIADIITYIDQVKTAWDGLKETLTAIDTWLNSIVGGEGSSWQGFVDALFGGGEEGEENPLLTKLMGWWEGVAAWSPAALAFDLSTFLFGGGEEGEEGEANPILTKLMGWWEGVVAWTPAALAIDLATLLFGGAEEGGEGEENPLLTKLMGWWEGVVAWTPAALAIDLTTLLFGGGEEGEEGGGEENPLLTKLMGWWEGVVAWTPAALAIDLTTLLFGGGEEGEEGEGGENPILTKLMGWWEGVVAWTPAALAIDLATLLFGGGEEEGGENPLVAKLTEWWDAAMEWLGGLVPDISLTDIILGVEDVGTAVDEFMTAIGEAFVSGWDSITQTFSDFFTSLYNDYWLYYLGADGVLVTGILDFFSVLYNDYWLYYFGADGVLVTGILDFFTVLYNDYWLYYFGPDGVLITGILDFFTVLYNDYWLYYFGPDGILITGILDFFTVLYNDYWLYYFGLDGVLITGILDFFTTLYNDYWLYYFGLDGVLITGILDFFTSLYNDYWLYYFGLDGVLVTGIIDFFTTLYNDYWLYYFGLDGVLITAITDFFTSLYNDYFLYYLGADGVVVTAAADAWTAMVEGVTAFVAEFGNVLGQGLADGINAGIGYLQGLLDAIDAVLTAINVSPLGVTLPTVEFAGFAEGGSTESMAAGGSRGGAGSRAREPRHIVWNEGMGEEYWIATGPAADRRKNVGWLAKAASALGLGIVPMQAGGVIGSGGRLAGVNRTRVRPPVEYLAREFPDETTTATTAATTAGTAGEKKLTRKQKRRERRKARREKRRGTGTTTTTGLTGTTSGAPTSGATTSPATTTAPTSSVPGTSAVDAMPAATSALAAPAGMTRAPTATGGSKAGRRRGRQRGRTHRGGARFSNMHRGHRRRHKRAGGGDTTFMAIGGGTDTGPAGLGERAGGIAQEIMDAFGVWANTYVGGATPHGSLHGNVPENTFDFWGDSGFTPLDVGTGDAILAYLYENYGSELDTVIWQGIGEGPGGSFEDGEHFDHLHASIGGGGILGGAGSVALALFNKMKGIWDSAMSALGDPVLGEGPLWDGIETYLMTLPMMAWEWLKSKVPRGTGSSIVRGLGPSGNVLELAQQGIELAGWPADELSALSDLWQNESGWDANIVNPESGAYGIPQILPSAHPDAPGIGDAAGQIEWGLNYIAERYGSPTAALDFWLANGWYALGGVVPGAPGTPQSAVVHGGERVLPQNINRGFENLAQAVDRWDDNSASGMGGTGANSEAEAVLEDILVEIKRGNDNPTPVDINNMSDMQRSFITGFMAGIESDASTEVLDRKMAEGVRFASTLGGL